LRHTHAKRGCDAEGLNATTRHCWLIALELFVIGLHNVGAIDRITSISTTSNVNSLKKPIFRINIHSVEFRQAFQTLSQPMINFVLIYGCSPCLVSVWRIPLLDIESQSEGINLFMIKWIPSRNRHFYYILRSRLKILIKRKPQKI